MKKKPITLIFAMLFALIFAFNLVACGNDGSAENLNKSADGKYYRFDEETDELVLFDYIVIVGGRVTEIVVNDFDGPAEATRTVSGSVRGSNISATLKLKLTAGGHTRSSEVVMKGTVKNDVILFTAATVTFNVDGEKESFTYDDFDTYFCKRDKTPDDFDGDDNDDLPANKSLNVWASDVYIETYRTLSQRFKTEYDNGRYRDYTFNFREVDPNVASDRVRTASGVPADVMMLDSNSVETIADKLEPVSMQYAGNVKNRNMSAAADMASVNGSLLGFPVTLSNGWFMYYDSTFFTSQDIESLDTMIEKASSAGKRIMFSSSSAWYSSSFFFGMGCSLGYDRNGEFDLDFNSAAGVEAGKAMVRYLGQNDVMWNYYLINECPDYFNDRSIVAAFCGSWVANEMPAYVRAAKCPRFYVDGQPKQMCSFIGGSYLGVSKYSAEKEAAQAFANYITAAQAQRTAYAETGYFPTNIAVLDELVRSGDDLVEAQYMQYSVGGVCQKQIPSAFWLQMETFANQISDGIITESNLQARLNEMVADIKAGIEI